jgi:uncharacterized protein with HEPN domain
VTKDKDERRLLLIQRDIDRIDKTVRSHASDAFFNDEDVQDAIIQRLYRIADSASELSQEIQDRHTDIPWGEIAGTRVVLAHGYARMALPLLWKAVEDDLPQLRAMVDHELRLQRDHREREDRSDDDERSR